MIALAGIMLSLAYGASPGTDSYQWGGPDRDFVVREAKLQESWPEDGPRVRWETQLGPGYSSVVADAQRLYTMYHQGEEDIVVALDKRTGRRQWEYRYREPFKGDGYGPGPNATPLIVGTLLYTVSAGGKLHALDTATGKVKWSRDLVAAFKCKIPWHGYSCSPLEYGGKIILPVGGSEGRGVVALDALSGQTAWRNGGSVVVSYASPQVVEMAGKPQAVFNMKDRIFAIDPVNGDPIWSVPQEGAPMHNAVMTPVLGKDGTVWISARCQGVGDGNRTFRITRRDGDYNIDQLYWKKRNRVETHVNALRVGDVIYTSLGSNRRAKYVAIDVRTGSILWEHRGLGGTNSIYADGRLIILDEFGRLVLAKPDRKGLGVQHETQLETDRMWTPPMLTDGLLVVRDHNRVIVLEVGHRESSGPGTRPVGREN